MTLKRIALAIIISVTLLSVTALLLQRRPPVSAPADGTFEISTEYFLRNGKPHVIRGGELHYPRVPREYWRDRLRKARAMGLNTIATYTFWNLHEPRPGRFDFSGNLDVAEFVRIASEEGLDVIIKPGPYICTETDFGGFPPWLLETPGMRVRSRDPRFLEASARYMKRIARELTPLEVTRGGPIIMVQVENEYGSYDNDHEYMAAIRDQIVEAGWTAPLFTSDWPSRRPLEGGTLPDVLPAINFGGSPRQRFNELREFRPGVPHMVGEYWAGWFDQWGTPRRPNNAHMEAEAVDWLLANDISFILYMYHGGTTFGFMAGANYSNDKPYQPQISSYDYNAALDEAGQPTQKYFLFRETIRNRLPQDETLPHVPRGASTISIEPFELGDSLSLLDALPALSRPVEADSPLTMEALGQSYGFVLYRTKPNHTLGKQLFVNEVRDYAVILVDGKIAGTLDRRKGESMLPIRLNEGATLDLLVENMGRTNFGEKLVDGYKGITREVKLGEHELSDWEMWGLPLDDLSKLRFRDDVPVSVPVFRRGFFELDEPGDTFLDMRGWGKGHVWVNGRHLGRFWSVGPQQTLYLPGVWLKRGRNEVIVFDVEGGGHRTLQGLTDPVFDVP